MSNLLPRKMARYLVCAGAALSLILPVTGQEPQLDQELIEQMKEPLVKSEAPSIVRFGETELQFIGAGSEGMHITNIPVIRGGDEPVNPERVRVETRYVAMQGAVDDPSATANFVEDKHTTRNWRSEPIDWNDQQQELLETRCAAPPDSEVIGFVAVLLYGDTVQDGLIRGSEAYNQVLAEQLAFLMANSLGDVKFGRKPFQPRKDTLVGAQVKWENQLYHWEPLKGVAQSDIVGRATFQRDGSNPVVEVRKRISNPQEAQLAPVTEPRSVVPEKREVEPATVFEP